MRHRALFAASLTLLIAVAVVGCDLISEWIDSIGGGSTGGFTSARISFSLQGNVARNDVQAQTTVIETKILGTSFQADGTYDAMTRTFSATWDGGDYSQTSMQIRLDPTGGVVERFEARQTRTRASGAWTEVCEISGHDVLFLVADGPARLFLVEGTATSVIIDSIEYREWSRNVGTQADPFYRLVPPQLDNIWSDETSYVEIRLDR